ncbi:MAG: hypothetical protein HC895_08565 [Leptolyngbyaceae cyanobacterium SM1_3_5]|nr:hypothetical protein [Leptolyngbyaceae cyanobacterium SM1_3_5]
MNMRVTSFVCSSVGLVGVFLAGCSQPIEPGRSLPIEQRWQLQPGDTIGGHRIAGGLGDISIELNGDPVYAPADGRVQPVESNPLCVVFEARKFRPICFACVEFAIRSLGKCGRERRSAKRTRSSLPPCAVSPMANGQWSNPPAKS